MGVGTAGRGCGVGGSFVTLRICSYSLQSQKNEVLPIPDDVYQFRQGSGLAAEVI